MPEFCDAARRHGGYFGQFYPASVNISSLVKGSPCVNVNKRSIWYVFEIQGFHCRMHWSVNDTFDKSNITRLISCYHDMAKNILVVYWFSGTIEDYIWSIGIEQNGLTYTGRSPDRFPNGPKSGEYTHYGNPIVWLTFGDHLLCIYRFLIAFIDKLPHMCNCPLQWHRTCGPLGHAWRLISIHGIPFVYLTRPVSANVWENETFHTFSAV